MTNEEKLYYISFNKDVTRFNEENKDWSGEFQHIQNESKSVFTTEDVEKFLNMYGLEFKDFEQDEDENNYYRFNQLEDEEGYPSEKGKYLADYVLFIQIFTPTEEIYQNDN